MHITRHISELTSRIISSFPSAVPGIVISSYLKYLWDYEPDSWVAKIAYSARVVAILVSLPVAILGLLDIASYGIARTLGVVDDVKASTSDEATKRVARMIPAIHINGESTPASESGYTDSERESPGGDRVLLHRQRKAKTSLLAVSQPKVFYASGDNSLKLAGADIFSPAASQPPSPTISRRTGYFEESRVEDGEKDRLVAGLRRRLPQANETAGN